MCVFVGFCFVFACFFFETLDELEKFLREVPHIRVYTWDSKTGKWVSWARVKRVEDNLQVTIPTVKGVVKINIDLQTGKIATKSLEKM